MIYYIVCFQYQKQILFEIATAKFVSITVDGTVNIVNMFRLVFCYKIKSPLVERFSNPDEHNTES